MWIQVRSMDGKEFHKIKNLSKLTKVEDLRLELEDKFHATVDRLRLFYRGKQLEDGYTLFDYDVGLNDIVQVLVRPLITDDAPKLEVNGIDKNHSSSNQEESDQSAEKMSSDEDATKENKMSTSQSSDNLVSEESGRSKYYKVGDLIDTQDFDLGNGAWFEAKIMHIKKRIQVLETNSDFSNCASESDPSKKSTDDSSSVTDDGLEYTARFERYEDDPLKLQLKDFRPRARRKVKFDDVKVGDVVMVNYNFDEPKELGYWYDGEVTKIKNARSTKKLIVRIHIGRDRIPMDGCEIHLVNEVFAIENHKLLADQDLPKDSSPVVRVLKPNCAECRDDPDKKCKHCSCQVCGGKEDPHKQLLCDECDGPFHIYCLNPPLADVPEGDEEWFCPSCANDHTEVVKAGEKLKESKKKAKMASANSTSNRDWGRGMACVGRTKMCTIVPSDHFGPIPGIEVGTMWKFRVQVSESGVHRPHVAGIHGREGAGAFSIVLSGGYEDDLDEGEEFKYTGSGGRDLSGNKRTAEQSCDQTLTRMNKALALNCDAALSSKGAEAKNWKAGKPVRVVRNHKGSKHSKYCPEEGNRYDGIYKVIKYWPEKGKSGHLVWRYQLKRDDPAPAPWTKAGKERIKKLGLKMQYPDGYLENAEENSDPSTSKGKGSKVKNTDDKSDFASTRRKGKKTKRKEKLEEIIDDEEEESKASSPKKQKYVAYEIPPDVEKLIDEDQNKKLWDECKEHICDGSQAFLEKVQETFACVCCQELVFKPVTTECLHNACKTCLTRSFKAEVFTCPVCRFDLGKDYSMHINRTLSDILLKLFPGYDSGR